MYRNAILLTFWFVLCACRADAQQAIVPAPPVPIASDSSKDPISLLFEELQETPGKDPKLNKDPKLDKGKQPMPPDLAQPQPDPFASVPEAGDTGESTAGFNPHMMGDFFTKYSR